MPFSLWFRPPRRFQRDYEDYPSHRGKCLQCISSRAPLFVWKVKFSNPPHSPLRKGGIFEGVLSFEKHTIGKVTDWEQIAWLQDSRYKRSPPSSINKQKGRTYRRVQPSVARPCFDLLMLRLAQHPPLSVPSLQKVWLYRVIHYNYYFHINIHNYDLSIKKYLWIYKLNWWLRWRKSFCHKRSAPRTRAQKNGSF